MCYKKRTDIYKLTAVLLRDDGVNHCSTVQLNVQSLKLNKNGWGWFIFSRNLKKNTAEFKQTYYESGSYSVLTKYVLFSWKNSTFVRFTQNMTRVWKASVSSRKLYSSLPKQCITSQTNDFINIYDYLRKHLHVPTDKNGYITSNLGTL